MKRYRKILVAFDGSDSARNALAQAIGLARAGRSWIKLLAVVPKYEGDVELSGIDDIGGVIKGPVEEMLAEAENQVKEAGVPVLTDIEQGRAYDEIVEVSRDERCDLIVMGRKGKHRIEKMLMGSVTAQVVAESDFDVLIVPNDTSLSWDRMLYVLDATSTEQAMKNVVEHAKSLGVTLHAVSVVDMYPEFYAEAPSLMDRLEKAASDRIKSLRDIAALAGCEVETHMRSGEPHAEIVKCASEINAGSILMGKSEKANFLKIVSGNILGKVIGFASCPVLVMAEART